MKLHLVFLLSLGLLFQPFNLSKSGINYSGSVSAATKINKTETFQADNTPQDRDPDHSDIHDPRPDHSDIHDPRPDYSHHSVEVIFVLLALVLCIISFPILYERRAIQNHRHFVPNTMLILAAVLLFAALLYLGFVDYAGNPLGAGVLTHHWWEVICCIIAMILSIAAVVHLHRTRSATNHEHTLPNWFIGLACLAELLVLLSLLGLLQF